MPIALPQNFRHFITHVPLRWVLTVPFVLLTVGATTLVGYLSYQSGQEAVENLGRQLVAQTNERVTQELKISLQTPLLINRLNVGAVNQGQLDLQNIPALEATLFNQLQQFDPVSAILFASPQGTFRVVERYPVLYLGVADPPRPEQIRIYNLDSQGNRGQLVYVDNEGLDVRRDRPFYRRAVTTGQPGWNLISQYGTTEELTLDASQPVYDRATKSLLGVFAVHIRLDYLSKFLQSLNINRAGQIIIVDQDGALIATSTREPLYKVEGTGLKSQFKRLNIDQSDNALTRSLGEHLRDRSGGWRSLDQTQSLEFRYNGEVQYVKITPFQDQYGLNWHILTVIPKSHFMGSIQNNKGITALLCVLTLGGAIALGLFAGNRLIARFAQLNRASRELAAGNLDQRLPTDRSIYELNCLAQTFNHMADQLQQSFDRLRIDLAASEGKFTTIFRSSPDSIVLATWKEGRCVEANESFLNLLEYSHQELIGKQLLALGIWINPIECDHFREALQQNGCVCNLEVCIGMRTGHIKTLLLSAELVEMDGKIYILGIGRDISDRARIEAEHKQAEEALRQSETLNRVILNALPDLIIRMHRDGTYLDIKPTTAFPTGLPNFGVGQNVQNILSPEAAQQRLDAATTALQTREVQVYEFSLWVEGQRLWQEVRVIPLDTDEVLVVLRDLTQRNQMEEALRESEERFRQLAETVREGFFVFETESSHYSYVNPAYEAIMATPFQTLYQGMFHWLNHIHPDDRDRIEAGLRRESQGENFDEEYRFIRPDGEIRWLQSKAFPLQNEAGTVVRVVGTVKDISDRKWAEIALQESEARFQEIAQTINHVVYVISVSTAQYLYISPAYEKLWGYSCESLYQNPKSWLDRIYAEDLEYVLQVMSQLFSGIQMQMEYRIICSNGEVRWIRSESLIVPDEDGNPLRIVGLAEDINDRKQAEAALQESEERFRRAFNGAPIGTSLVTPTGQFVKVNPFFCDLVGYTKAELLTLTFQDITHPADLETDVEAFQQMMAGEIRSYQMEKRYVTKQGTVVPVIINTAPIRDQNGQMLYCVGHIQDIRDRLKVERMKDEFISVISHELRTPLTSIRGALGILGSGVLSDRPEKAQQMLQIAINNSDRLVRLVDDILKLERLESGKVQLIMEQCQATDLMQQAINSVQGLADQTGITLSLTPLPTTLSAAPDAITQTLTNLLSNALKFSVSGNMFWLKAEILTGQQENSTSIPPHCSPLPSPCILFTVKDQGRGIPQDKLQLIFEQFQQVDVSDSLTKGGTGLGLAICKKIVQQHGGQIWAESNLGKGSTFYFALPLTREKEPDDRN